MAAAAAARSAGSARVVAAASSSIDDDPPPPDHYAVLGVRKGASASARRAAYRTLARTEHPDVSDKPDAQERFAAIAEAYRVLGDEAALEEWEKDVRRHAQRSAARNAPVDVGAPPDAAALDVYASVSLTTTEARDGCTKHIKMRASRSCKMCSGKGYRPGSAMKKQTCGACKGSGKVLDTESGDLFARLRSGFQAECGNCNGLGYVMVAQEACKTCSGTGFSKQAVTQKLQCPPGLQRGSRMRVPGLGDYAGSQRGDLYVTVAEITPDPGDLRQRFSRATKDAREAVNASGERFSAAAKEAKDTVDASGQRFSTAAKDAADSEVASMASEGVKTVAGVAFVGLGKIAISALDAINEEQKAAKERRARKRAASESDSASDSAE
eukprot:PRCOL_00000592-RA